MIQYDVNGTPDQSEKLVVMHVDITNCSGSVTHHANINDFLYKPLTLQNANINNILDNPLLSTHIY